MAKALDRSIRTAPVVSCSQRAPQDDGKDEYILTAECRKKHHLCIQHHTTLTSFRTRDSPELKRLDHIVICDQTDTANRSIIQIYISDLHDSRDFLTVVNVRPAVAQPKLRQESPGNLKLLMSTVIKSFKHTADSVIEFSLKYVGRRCN